MKLHDRVSKLQYGEKTVLKTFGTENGEVYIIPRKFTIAEQDRINELERKALSGIKRGEAIKAIAKIQSRKNDKTISEEDLLAMFSDEEFASMMDVQVAPSEAVIKYKLAHGIAYHNMTEDDAETDVVDDDMVKDLMSVPELATEILQIVTSFNAPLAPKTSEISEMSQNGSTTGVNMTGTISAQMDDAQQN